MFNVVFFGPNGKALASKLDTSSLLVGDGLYYASTQLSGKTFANEFASIISGRYMFASSNIKTFSGSLTSLQDGTRMFEAAGALTSFTSEIPNLSNGTYMFYNTPLLATFSSSLPNLRSGECMFQNAKVLPSFSVSLPKLTNGLRMFDGCASLETFNSVLPSLENGSYMFQGCKLSGRSVRNIVESLPTHETEHSITIGINCTEDIKGQREFLCETGYNTFEEIEDALAAKGWKVVWHFQGFPSGWRPVEYLEAPGEDRKHPYIMLGREFDNVTKYEMVATGENVGRQCQLFGAWDLGNRIACVRFTFNTAPNVMIHVGNQRFEVAEYKFGDKVTFVLDMPNGNIKINDKEATVSEANTEGAISGLVGVPYAIFAVNYPRDTILGGSYSRIFSYKETQGDKMLVNLIPCVDSTGAPCMYDVISKKSYYNQGGYDFTYSPTSTTYSLRQPVAEFAQLTDSGVRKLYHLPYDYEGTLEEFVEENGFKQLIENEQPEEGNWEPVWAETEDAVVLTWSEVLNSVEDEA